jgi:hypothetical protein
MDTLLREKAERQFKITRRIGYVWSGSLLIIAIAVEVVKRQYAPFQGFYPFPQMEQLRYILLAVATITLVALRFLRYLILSNTDSSPVSTKHPSIVHGATLIEQLRLVAIISYAVCYSIAIYGLVLFLVGGKTYDCYLFMALSVVAFYIYFPRFDQWEQHLLKAEREPLPSKKSPSGRVRQFVIILLVMGMLVGVIAEMREQDTDLKEKKKQEAIRPTPVPKEEKAAPSVMTREESKEILGVIPSLDAKVTILRFFESGYKPTDMGKRDYAGRFRRDRSRYIYWELHMEHPTRERRSDFQIDEIWYKPDGSILAKQSLKRHLEESWVNSFHYHSRGWEEPSHWIPGKYRLELSTGGSRFAVGFFTIYEEDCLLP